MAGDITGLTVELGLNSQNFTKGMTDIKRDLKSVNSEMRSNMSAFDRGEKSVEKYSTRLGGLEKKLKVQGQAVDSANDKYKTMVERHGENSVEAQKAGDELNRQVANYNNLERAVDSARKDLEAFQEQQRIANSNWTKMGNALETNGQKFVKTGQNVTSVGKSWTKASSVILGGVTALGAGLFGLTAKSTEAADAIAKGSEKMGISTDFYQESAYWASQNGISQEQMEKAIGRLNQRMGQALDGNEKYAGALEKLGVDLGAVEDGSLSTEDAMAQSISTLSEMDNEHEKAALATEMFGTRMARDLLPALNDGSLSMDEAREKAQELGLVMSQDQLEAAETFQDSMDDIKRSLGAVGMQIGLDLMPHFQKMLDWIIAHLPQIRDTISTAFDAAVEKVKNLKDWWTQLSGTSQKLLIGFGALAAGMGPILMVTGKVITFMGHLQLALAPVFKVVGKHGLGGALKLLAGRFSFLLGPVGIAIGVITTLATVFTTAYAKSETFRNIVQNLIERFRNFLPTIVNFGQTIYQNFMTIITPAIETVRDFFVDMFQKIKKFWDTHGNQVIEAITNGINIVRTIVTEAMPIIKTVINTTFQNVKTVIQTVWGVITSIISGALDVIMGIVKWFTGLFTGDFELMAQGTKQIFGGILSAITGILQSLFTGAINIIKNLVSGGVNLFQSLWQRAKEIWGGLFTSVVGFVTNIFTSVTDWFSNLWTRCTEIFNSIRSSISNIVSNLVSSVINFFTNMYNTVTNWFSNLLNTGRNIFNNIRSTISNIVSNLVSSVGNFFSNMFSNVRKIITNLYKTAKKIFNNIRKTIVDIVDNLKNRVIKWFNVLKDTLDNIMDTLKTILSNAWTWIKDTVTDTAENLWSGVKSTFDNLFQGTKDIFNNVKTWLSDTWDEIKETVTGVAEDLWSAVEDTFNIMSDGIEGIVEDIKGFFEDMVEGVKKGINKLIDGINWVADKVGMDELKKIELSTGTTRNETVNRHVKTTSDGALKNGTFATVGDRGPGNGPNGFRHEMIQFPNGKMSMTPNKDTNTFLPAGSKVFNGQQTHDMLKLSTGTGVGGAGDTFKGMFDGLGESIASGAKKGWNWTADKASKAWDTAKDKIGDVWDFAKNPGKLVDKVIDHFGFSFDLAQDNTMVQDFLTGAYNKLKESVKGLFTGWLDDGGMGGDGSSFTKFGKSTPYSPNSPVAGYPSDINNGHHFGIDYKTPHGTPIDAPTDGKVTKLNDTGGGLVAKLLKGKFTQFFMHLSDIMKTGQVSKGDTFAKTGNSGKWTTGSHLHYQVEDGNSPYVTNKNTIDPEKFLKGAGGAAGRSKSAEKWRPQVKQALNIVGLPTSKAYQDAWVKQIDTESGGDAGITQQIQDINSGGNEAQGLVQVIPPTFSAYKKKGYGNIHNGLHNLVAGMNYAKSRYGIAGMLGTIGKGHGYENGGILDKDGLFRGAEGDKEEVVIPLENPSNAIKLMNYVASKLSGGGKGTSQVPNVSAPGNDTSAIEDKLDQMIELLTMMFGKEWVLEMDKRQVGKATFDEIKQRTDYKERRTNKFNRRGG